MSLFGANCEAFQRFLEDYELFGPAGSEDRVVQCWTSAASPSTKLSIALKVLLRCFRDDDRRHKGNRLLFRSVFERSPDSRDNSKSSLSSLSSDLWQLPVKSYPQLMTTARLLGTSGARHRWDVDVRGALEIQGKLRKQLSPKDGFVFRKIRWIAGADAAYAIDGGTIFGAVVVLSFPDLAVAEKIWVKRKVQFPYIPGLLSFREAPVLLEACSLLRQRPDVILFDAQGIAHPRGFGLASHAGLLLGLPSIGCAKTRLVGEYRPVARRRGSFSWLWFEGKKVGAAVRTRADVKPVFVSPGDQITIRAAIRLVLATCKGYRLPEPIRRAHQLANRVSRTPAAAWSP